MGLPVFVSDTFVEGTADHVGLLFRGKLDKVYCVAADPDGKLRIVFRMLLGIQQSIPVQNIYIQMMSTLGCIAVQQIYKIVDLG